MDIEFPGKIGNTAKYRPFMKKEKYQLSPQLFKKTETLTTERFIFADYIHIFISPRRFFISVYKSKSTFPAKSRSTCRSHKPGEAARHKTQRKQVATNSIWVFCCAFLCVWPFKVASGSISPE